VIDHDADSSTKDVARKFCASLSDVVELRLAPHPGISLVRPDGYIAYSAHNHDGIAAFTAVRSLLERQTRASAGVAPHGVHAQ
jgi:hypothetical protein